MCLNSLADDKLLASVRCLAANGHLLEIGKYDILKGTALSMRPMHDNITFHGINLDSLFKGAQKEAVSWLPLSGLCSRQHARQPFVQELKCCFGHKRVSCSCS